jgi:hypothetical protein
MFNRTPGAKPAPPAFDALEFELTDIGDARQALDELPPGVGDLDKFNPGYWEQRRRPPSAADRALTGVAVEWLVRLPPELRPQQLGARYPRLVNALATAWVDPARALATLDGLLVDRRGGRRGLPDAVQAELQLLRQHLQRMAPAPAAPRAGETAQLAQARALLEAAGYRVIPPGG